MGSGREWERVGESWERGVGGGGGDRGSDRKNFFFN